jgi:hypothetical protein
MSTLKQQQIPATDVTEDTVAGYLQAHPDFFERHPSLLTGLRLPHVTGGGSVSLVERQVSVLRQKNIALERKLKDLVDVARGNDQIAGKIHRLAMQFLQTTDRDSLVNVLEEQLRVEFGADDAVLVLFTDSDAAATAEQFLRLVRREDPRIAPFRTFLETDTPRCGQVRDSQRDFLFGAGNVEICSVALVPLGPKSAIGFLAIGNRDASHFHPGKSVDFLVRLGDLLGCALRNRH